MKKKTIVLVLSLLVLCILALAVCIWVTNRPATSPKGENIQQSELSDGSNQTKDGQSGQLNTEQGEDNLQEEMPLDIIPDGTSGDTGKTSGSSAQQGGGSDSGVGTGTSSSNGNQNSSADSNTEDNTWNNAGSSGNNSGQSSGGDNSGDAQGSTENTDGDAQQNEGGSTSELPRIPG